MWKNEFFYFQSVCEHDKESANHFVLLDSEGMRSKARVSFGGVVVVVVLFKDTSESILFIDVWYFDMTIDSITILRKYILFQLFTIWYYKSSKKILEFEFHFAAVDESRAGHGHTYLSKWNIIS